MMKSQTVAFLLGFTLTSVVLLFVPGISKKTSQTGNAGDHKLAGVTGNVIPRPDVKNAASYHATR